MPEQKKQSEMQKQESELRLLEERRAALVAEKEKVQVELAEARSQLRDGAPDALNAATIAQARYTALTETLDELGAQMEMLAADIEVSRATAQREEIIRQLVAIAKESCDHWRDYEDAQQGANEVLGPHVKRIIDATNQLGADRRRFVALFKELASGITDLTRMRAYDGDEQRQSDLDALVAELESYGADLSVVAIEWLTHFRTHIDRSAPAVTAEPFGGVIMGACQIARNLPESNDDDLNDR